jgi:trimethylamine:corrinoid methyltransferase-like protein
MPETSLAANALLHHWALFTEMEFEKLRSDALRLLTGYGFSIQNQSILEMLERRGLRVDFTAMRVWPSVAQVEALEAAARQAAPRCVPEPLLRRSLPGGESVGHNMTLYYDATECRRRAASLEDIRRVAKAWHMLAEIAHTGPCMTAQDVPPAIEPIVSAAEVMGITGKIQSCPELILASQLPYLEELETIMRGETVKYHTNGCSMTRFTVDARAADCLCAVAANGLEYWWVNSVPILGINAPVTLAGGVVYGIAETLGGWLAGWALNPDVELNAIPLSGMIDMRTGRILFSTPEAVLVDCALYQYFEHFYGIRIGLCSGYTDAKTPGLQALNDKLLKALGYGWFIDRVGGQAGTLEAGNTYSPTQQVIDLELNRQTAQLLRGVPYGTDQANVDEILAVLQGSARSFLTSEHTLAHMRDTLWSPRLFDRSAYSTDEEESRKTCELVSRAEDCWRSALSRYEPSGVDADKVRAAAQVVERAKKYLLS